MRGNCRPITEVMCGILGAAAMTLLSPIASAVQFNSVQTLINDLGDAGVLAFSPEDPVPSTTGDGCIYAVNSSQGKVRRVCFNASKTPLSTTDILDLNGSSGVVNLLLGITIDPAMPNGDIHLYLAYADDNTAPFNGKIARAVGTNQGASFTTDEDFIVGLPRSSFDHQTNGLEFGSDGCLYIVQGGNSNAGYDSDFAESRLSSALLRACFKNGDGTVNASFVRNCGGGNTQSPCDIKVYASGLRNPFDLLWHSNGFLYATDNDANPGFRDTCSGTVSNTFACTCQQPNQKLGDEINRIEQGKYYGSPNPYRANPSGMQCNGGANGSDACPPANCSTGGGSCQNLSSQCTAADSSLCGQQVQCYYFGAAQSGPDPNNLYRAPIAQVSDLRFDGFAEYSQRFPKLAVGGFCSDWDRDLLVTGAPGPVRRFDLAANGLSATIGPPASPPFDRGRQNIEDLSGLDVVVGSDGTIYVSDYGSGDVTYRTPMVQAGATNHFELCDPGSRCVNNVCKAICPGDCDLSEGVAVNELISSVGVSLGTVPLTQCAASDSDRDGLVSINELITAVNRALQGCSPPSGGFVQQLDRITIGTGSAIPGASVTIPISVVGSGGLMAGVQVDVLYDDAVFSITPSTDCTIASRLSSTHQFGAALPATPSAPAGKKRLRTIVYPRFDSILTFTDGVVANCTFQISSTGPPATYVLDGERQQASDTSGGLLTLQAQDGSITVCGGCGCS